MSLQPEELLLYSLIKLHSGDNFNFAKGPPEKFSCILRAIYNVYGINFDCTSLRNYFDRYFNNLRKYAGRLRCKHYSQNIQIVIRTHETDLENLLQSETVNYELYNDLHICVEHDVCLHYPKLRNVIIWPGKFITIWLQFRKKFLIVKLLQTLNCVLFACTLLQLVQSIQSMK